MGFFLKLKRAWLLSPVDFLKSSPAGGKLEALDGLRGGAALWVWLTHVLTMASLPLKKTEGVGRVLANGEFAVAIFILLSGFVISRALQVDKSNAAGFLIRRVFRLFPVYLVCLFVSVLMLQPSLEILGALPWSMERVDDRIRYLSDSLTYFWPNFGFHALLLHGLVPDSLLPSTSYAFMGQAWSLTLEWQFYLVAPACFWLLKRGSINLLGEVLVLVFLLLISRIFPQPSFLLSHLWLFYIGYLFYVHHHLALTCGEFGLGLRLVVWFLVALLFSKKAYALLPFAYVLWEGRRGGGVATRFLSGVVPMFLGKVSYGFYCIHMVLIFGLSHLLLIEWSVTDRVVYAVSLIFGSLIASLMAAALMHKLVEKPFIQYGKALARN